MADGMLTYDNPNGTWGLENGYDIRETPVELYGALAKLHDYEKTGVNPDEIAEIREIADIFAEGIQENMAELEKVFGKIPGKGPVWNFSQIAVLISDPKNFHSFTKLFKAILQFLTEVTANTKTGGRKGGNNDKL